MACEIIWALLQALIDKSGPVPTVVSRIGPISLATGETKKLTGVVVRLEA